jgi:predicted dehydrogenase
VLTEKPFAMDVIEGEMMVDSARRSGKVLAIVHNFQFSRAARALEADMKRGRLGKIQRVAATQLGNPRRRLPVWYEELPLGLFYDESPHFFYLIRRLSGGELMLRHGHAVAGQKGENTPSLVNLLYRGAGGIPVTIDCQFDAAISEWYVRVSGDKATGLIDIFRDIYIRLPNDGTHSAPNILRTSLAAIWQHAIQHIPNGLALLTGQLDYGNNEIFGRFARAIQTGQLPQDIAAEDALDVLKLQHEAIEELRKNLFP